MLTPPVPVLDLDSLLVLVAVVVSVFGGTTALIGLVRLVHDVTERLVGAPHGDAHGPAAHG